MTVYSILHMNQVWIRLYIFTFWLQQTNLLCISQPYCSLHLHLHVSENPYTSRNIVSKDSAPGIIIASGEEIIWSALWFAHTVGYPQPSCWPVIIFLRSPSQICSLVLFKALSRLNNSLQSEMKSIFPAHLFHVTSVDITYHNIQSYFK